MEGVNNAVAVYSSSYTLVSGPFSADTIFAAVKHHPEDTFFNPQVLYDASRVHWVILFIEVLPGIDGNGPSEGYLDIAVSKTITPTGIPASYNVYSFDVSAAKNGEFCDTANLGMEYWNLYVGCTTYTVHDFGFVGNRTFMFTKTDLYAGSGSPHWGWFYDLPTNHVCSSGLCPAFRVTPAIEDGVPQAEWVLATEAGYLGLSTISQKLILFAITNPNALSTGALPTGTVDIGDLSGSYSDFPCALQPGTNATLCSEISMKQVIYKGGHLWFSLTTGVKWVGDSTQRSGVFWASIEPFLMPVAAHNPQWVAGFNNHQWGYFGYVGKYTFASAIIPSAEGDAALVFNSSSATDYPSLVYTGRQNADALGKMGQGASAVVSGAAGIHANGAGFFGLSSTCALNVNPTTRGYAHCVGEYGGSLSSTGGTGWNTRLFVLRME
jgi:hypothetical protein